CYGLFYSAAPFALGVFYDRFGWKPTLLLHVLIEAIAMWIVLLDWTLSTYSAVAFPARVAMWIVWGALFGTSDACFNTVINGTIIQLFPTQLEAAYPYYNFVYCVGFSVQSAIADGALCIGLPWLTIIALGFLVLSGIGYLLLRRSHA